MKQLILASILLLPLCGQEKTPAQVFQLTPPKLIEPSVLGTLDGLKVWKSNSVMEAAKAKWLRAPLLMNSAAIPQVCSVPLLEAHADAVDPGIATMPANSAVPIRKAKVPAPACQK